MICVCVDPFFLFFILTSKIISGEIVFKEMEMELFIFR